MVLLKDDKNLYLQAYCCWKAISLHIIQYIDVANVKSFLLGIQGVHIQRKGCQRFLHYAMDDANTGCVLLRFKIYDSRSTIIHEFSFFCLNSTKIYVELVQLTGIWLHSMCIFLIVGQPSLTPKTILKLPIAIPNELETWDHLKLKVSYFYTYYFYFF